MDVMGWVGAYERAWRDRDAGALDRIFTEDALYMRSAYDEPGLRGLDEIRGFWDDDVPFRMTAEPLAVEGDTAVVRVQVWYEGDQPHEYRDLWILRFAADGRVQHFEEWAHWPGMPGWNPSVDSES